MMQPLVLTGQITDLTNLPTHLKNLFATEKLHYQPQPPAQGLYLLYEDSGLALAKAGHKGVVRVDFVQGTARHRRLFGGGELLARAVQAKNQPLVWDATGGLGRDAFVMASLGLEVVVFERNPYVYALLADGLQRALADEQTTSIAQRISLHYGSIILLQTEQKQIPLPDVVYLDPMYPQKQKSAAVKKEMAYFHELLGTADAHNDQALLLAAQKFAQKRVVVKRPANGVVLAEITPAFQYLGKTTRFDGYLPL
ncbi:16S rRNA methyltransferase [Snodgrassella alvi]|jgi:16S rRNA (guanine1516-N2)-methyltransferase|uniref:Ribosomal RNA small subunit methyltransferase J n=2 Tax=Snodgrassella alvi TaxID=1196083 RepID=A0A2N9XUF1_9NEIS|nr:class I SAM-dependent methyltransferase [Snodgrassella alvi]PIT52993.1 16S rRNA methyltransferase [Snodgrassella alvi]